MRKALTFFAILLLGAARLLAQCTQCAPNPTQLLLYPGVPSGTCTLLLPIMAEDTATGVLYGCALVGGVPTWVPQTGGIPGGSAFSGGLGASFQDATEIAAPANPAAGNDRLFLNSATHLLDCHTSSGASCVPSGSGTPGTPLHSIQFNSASAFAGTSVPTTPGQFAAGYTIACGSATPVDPTVTQLGLAPRTLSATDTVACTDVGSEEDMAASAGANDALALPTPTTLGNTGMFTRLVNRQALGGFSIVITPAAGETLNGGTGAVNVPPQQIGFVSIDPTVSTNWSLTFAPISPSGVSSMVQPLTGCSTSGNVYTPQANDCVAPSGGGAASILDGQQTTSFIPTGTQFLAGFGTSSNSGAQLIRVIPRAGTIGHLHVRQTLGVQGAAATFQVTLFTCTPSGTPLACTAVARAPTCTIATGASDCSDTADTFTVSEGDFVTWQTIQTGTGTSAIYAVTFTVQ